MVLASPPIFIKIFPAVVPSPREHSLQVTTLRTSLASFPGLFIQEMLGRYACLRTCTPADVADDPAPPEVW